MQPRISEALRRNIDSIAELEQQFLRQRSPVARLSDRISNIAGCPIFILGHLAWFAGWIVINTCNCYGIQHFDPYPFSFLGLCIAFEAALLSMFILMSQQRQTHQNEQWAHAGLQLGMLTEQETTKMLQMGPIDPIPSGHAKNQPRHRAERDGEGDSNPCRHAGAGTGA